MKEITKTMYQCEVCGTEYATEGRATDCEFGTGRGCKCGDLPGKAITGYTSGLTRCHERIEFVDNYIKAHMARALWLANDYADPETDAGILAVKMKLWQSARVHIDAVRELLRLTLLE